VIVPVVLKPDVQQKPASAYWSAFCPERV
jgi:hypothetical protein